MTLLLLLLSSILLPLFRLKFSIQSWCRLAAVTWTGCESWRVLWQGWLLGFRRCDTLPIAPSFFTFPTHPTPTPVIPICILFCGLFSTIWLFCKLLSSCLWYTNLCTLMEDQFWWALLCSCITNFAAFTRLEMSLNNYWTMMMTWQIFTWQEKWLVLPLLWVVLLHPFGFPHHQQLAQRYQGRAGQVQQLYMEMRMTLRSSKCCLRS